MESPSYQDPTHRHDFVLIFEVTDGNPNGDPDAGNLPRVDAGTSRPRPAGSATMRSQFRRPRTCPTASPLPSWRVEAEQN